MTHDILIFLVIQFFTVVAVIIYYRLKTGSVRETLRKQQVKLEQTSVKLNRLIEQSKFLENERNSMQAECSAFRKSNEQLKQQFKIAETEKEEQEARIEFMLTYKTQSEVLGEQLHELQSLLQQANSKAQQLEREQEALKLTLSDSTQHQEAMKIALTQLTPIKRQYELLAPQAAAIMDELEALKEKANALEKAKQDLSAQLLTEKMISSSQQSTIQSLEETARKYIELLKHKELLEAKLEQLQQKHELLSESNKHLQVQIEENKELVAVYRKAIGLLEKGKVADLKV